MSTTCETCGTPAASQRSKFCMKCGTPFTSRSVEPTAEPVAVEPSGLPTSRGELAMTEEPPLQSEARKAYEDIPPVGGPQPQYSTEPQYSSEPQYSGNWVQPAPAQSWPVPQQPAHVQVNVAAPVAVVGGKSAGVALVLTFFFGPFGMLYSTVGGALVMFGLWLLLGWTLVAIPFLWVAEMVWAAVAANSSNMVLAAGRPPNAWGR